VVSGDFAKKFKERVKVRKEKRGEEGRISMVARADFVFLCRAAMGEMEEEREEEEEERTWRGWVRCFNV
jgi:hypothetical protein